MSKYLRLNIPEVTAQVMIMDYILVQDSDIKKVQGEFYLDRNCTHTHAINGFLECSHTQETVGTRILFLTFYIKIATD